MNYNYSSDKELEEKEEITEVNFSPALYNISSEILKLFNNCKNSANENNSISLNLEEVKILMQFLILKVFQI